MYFTPQRKNFEKLFQFILYISTLEICDYTVCDVTNLKMTIIK